MDRKVLIKINEDYIRAAGPRYSPGIEPDAPNIVITDLLQAIDSLSLNEKYRKTLSDYRSSFAKAWNGTSKSVKSLFTKKLPQQLIKLLGVLAQQKAGKSNSTLVSIQKAAADISSILQNQRQNLRSQQQNLDQYSKEWNSIQSELSVIRELEYPLNDIFTFINSPNFKLISNNKMFLSGEWGTGKTHLLCDITKQRMKLNLPTLFILAHRLPFAMNPLDAICQITKLASSPEKLIMMLNKLGKQSNSRALLIIDGINETDKKAWKKYMFQLIRLVSKYSNIGLILSCRSPFDNFILTNHTRRAIIRVVHNGFRDIEFNAQREFFSYYKIPNPNVPLLTPEFSRPLFLKILCLTFSGQTSSTKSKWIHEIASGQRSMTKLFEDFVVQIGRNIECEFNLGYKTCWRILKGHKINNNNIIGIAVSMADQVKDYLTPNECLSIIKNITGRSNREAHNILQQLIFEGLLVDDIVWEDSAQIEVIRFPYQRFSDHLISRHLLKKHLNTTSEQSIRRSFYKHRPLGKIFEVDELGRTYLMPGLATAIMLEFPERVKNKLSIVNRELVYYLPQKNQLFAPLVDSFLDGVLWRSKDSFSKGTDIIFDILLKSKKIDTRNDTLETLVSLACRTNHSYSAERLYKYLGKSKLSERDLFWSEFLRNTYGTSVIYRLINWIEDSSGAAVNFDTAKNLIILLSLLLTTTDRALRDKATKALVIIGEKQPKALFDHTLASLIFTDPYVPERMLAATYGVLMRSWAFPKPVLIRSIADFAKDFYTAMFTPGAPCYTTHILARDYALGILELADRIQKNCWGKLSISNIKKSFHNQNLKIPRAGKISEKKCENANKAIHKDFENYTVGSLIPSRHNYDSKHLEYRGVLKQIKWRILDLGFTPDLFEEIDRSISDQSYYRSQKENQGRVDRYGKKYSWIAFFEVAGIRQDNGLLKEYYKARIPDCDIDPSFPEPLNIWKPKLKNLFTSSFTTDKAWAGGKITPSYDHLLQIEVVDKLNGPYILLEGYINESALKDEREVFTFITGILVNPKDIQKLRYRFLASDYPGNYKIPNAIEDHYTFAGEIPWSEKYAMDSLPNQKRHLSYCFEINKHYTIRKKIDSLTTIEKFQLTMKSVKFNFDDSSKNIQKEVNENVKNLPKYVDIPQFNTIPGIRVEVPVHRLAWESYHSIENQGGTADFVAPALCKFLKLRNKGNSQDLYDIKGNHASIYRIFGDKSEYFKSNLLFIRKDLLKEYLQHTNQKLVWFIWGERGFKAGKVDKIQLRDLWKDYRHIHRKFKVAKIS